MVKLSAKRALVRALMKSQKMKVYKDRYNVATCQNCFNYLKDTPNYCPECGQRLEWD